MKRLLFILALVCAPTYAQTNTARMLSGTNVVTSCPYTIQVTDQTKLLVFNSASACTVTMPAASTINFGAGAMFSVTNQGAGTATITPATGTIGGHANLALTTGQGADIYSDGANYQVQPGSGNGGGGGGSPPAGSNGDTQCKNALLFSACVQNPVILYVSTSGNDTNSGKTWDTAKLTIMGAVCALPNGNCSTNPRQAGQGTVIFGSGVSCNSVSTGGCWIASNGDSQYPNMTSAVSGPTAWTVSVANPNGSALNLICGTNDVSPAHQNKPSCVVKGPDKAAGIGNLPIVWITGNTFGIYINGLSGGFCCAFPYNAAWGRIGIDSVTTKITSTPTVTQTSNVTIENSSTNNITGSSNILGAGPQLAMGNGFWNHLHDDQFFGNNAESCQVSAASRTSNVATITTTGCGATSCPFVTGDHVSIRDTAGDLSFNGTFTVASGCSGSTFTFNQTGPNFSSSVGSAGIVSDDRAFGAVFYGTQVEMARIHEEGNGMKFYGGPNSNLQLNDVYLEGGGTLTQPVLWESSLIYGGGGTLDLEGLFQADTPLLPTVINEGALVFLHNQSSNTTNIRGPLVALNGTDAFNRTAGLLATGQSGWYDNTHFESSTDIARRQAPITSRMFTNFAAQNPASWSGSNFTTTSGKRDPFGGTGAIEIDATALTSAYIYNNSQTVNVGDTWYFGGWVRAVNGTFSSSQEPFAFYLGSGNLCLGNTSQPLGVFTPFLGDGNWSWVAGSCQVWSTAGATAVQFAVGLNSSTPVQVYRPFVFVVSPSLGISATEVADEINSLAFGPSTQAGAGDVVFPADKKLCMPSGSATDEYCAYLTHSNTANRTYTLPDQSGVVALESSAGTVTGQVLTAQNSSPAAFASPGILDGNGGATITTTPYTIQCDSGTMILDRAHMLRFQSGASVVTVPLSSATGCAGGFVVTAVDDGAGTLTFNRTSPDTFSVFNGSTNTDSATSFTLTNGQYATLNQGASGIWEVRIVNGGGGGSPVAGVFNAATVCNGLTNCVQWVDDDSTDNCGSSTTTWVSAINTAGAAGKGIPQVFIWGGMGGKAYKFSSCNLVFTGGGASTGTGVHIHLSGSIDCAMALQSCIQFGATSTSGGAGSNNASMQSFRLDGGGAIVGGHSLTGSGGNGSGAGAGVYIMPHISAAYIDGITFGGTGANLGFGVNSTYGTCSTYAIMFDNPLPTGTVTNVVAAINSNGITSGACGFGNPGGASAGSNTIMFTQNIIFADGESGGSGQCGSIGISDGGTLGNMDSNNIFGFGISVLLSGIGHRLTSNQLDNTQCGSPQAIIQIGGSSNVGPMSILNNIVQLDSVGTAHAKNLIALQSGATATLVGTNIIANQNNDGTGGAAIMPFSLNCTPYGSGGACVERDNTNINAAITCNTSNQGWKAGNVLAQCFPSLQTANLGSTTLMAASANYTQNGLAQVSCQVAITTAATTSSTLPQCSVSYTDGNTNTIVTILLTPAWAANTPGCTGSTTNTVGNSCQGSALIYPKANNAITFSTSGYASVGGTAMTYQPDAYVVSLQ